jgi:hypothetical protein
LFLCSAMHPWGHRPIKVAMLLRSALYPAARAGGVVTWHRTEKCMHGVFEETLVRTEREWVVSGRTISWWALGEIREVRWWRGAELCRAEGPLTCLCFCSGCSHPAAASHGVSRHLCLAERVAAPT